MFDWNSNNKVRVWIMCICYFGLGIDLGSFYFRVYGVFWGRIGSYDSKDYWLY